MSVSENVVLSPEDSGEIDLMQLVGILLDRRWFIVLFTALFLVFGVVYAEFSTPIYTADALIQVQPKNQGVMGLGELGKMFPQDSPSQAQIEILKSRMILGQTVDQMNLTTVATPHYFPIFGKGWARLSGHAATIRISQFSTPELSDFQKATLIITNNKLGTYNLLDATGQSLLQGQVGRLENSTNGYHIFVAKLSGKNGQKFTLTKQPYLSAVQQLGGMFTVSEEGQNTGMLDLTMTGANPSLIQALLQNISQNYFLQNIQQSSAEAQQSLTFLQKNLPAVKAKLIAAENALNAYRQSSDSLDLKLQAQNALNSVVKVDQQLNELSFQETAMTQKFTKSYPGYIALMKNRQVLLATKAQLEGNIQKMPAAEKQVIALKRNVEVNQQMYMQMLNKVQELDVVKAGTVGNVRIIDNALSFPHPIKPKKSLLVVLAVVIGFILASLIVLIRAILNKGVENPDDIEKIGLSVYATIPESEWQIKTDKQGKITQLDPALRLLAAVNPADLAIESIRSLRTSLHFAMLEAQNNILMISGSAPSVGKSFVSSNMAAVLAKGGQKVLLIDADMRRGKLGNIFPSDHTFGLSNYLSGQKTSEECVSHSVVDNLDFMPCGDVPPNPAELLMHQRFSELLVKYADQYDFILIDTPPILAVTDAAIVGKHAGTTMMVGRCGITALKEIEAAKQRFEKLGIKVNGFILNAVKLKSHRYYGQAYYQYEYKK